MLGYLLRRVLAAIPVMAVVALFVFLLLRLTPGDPAAILAGDNATPEQLERIRISLGLNEPLYIAVLHLGRQVSCMAISASRSSSNVPVLKMIGQRIEPSIAVAIATIMLSVLVAVPLGVIAAWKQGTLIDRFVMGLSVVGFLGPGVRDRLCPDPDFRHRPALASGAGISKHRRRLRTVLRAAGPADGRAVLHLCRADRAHDPRLDAGCAGRGLCADRARQGHRRRPACCSAMRLRNAAVPVITVIGTGFALLISGVVVTESVFNIPGIGRLTVDAVLARDYPVIQAMILLTSLLYVGVNLLIDVAYTLLDPQHPLLRPTDGNRDPSRTVDPDCRALRPRGAFSHLDADHRDRHVCLALVIVLLSILRPGSRRTIRFSCCRHSDSNRPATQFPLGTDAYGRDVLSRILYGGRISLLIGFGATVSIGIGLLIGLFSGFFKWIDAILMRIMDGLMAIPASCSAIAVVSLSGASLMTRDGRDHHSGNSARGTAGALRRAVGARGALCRGRDFGRLRRCRKSCGGI